MKKEIRHYNKLKTIMINMLTSTVAYVFLMLYTSIYDFSFYMSILMTFTWGVQDAGINTYINALLGFQFDSKTTPFSVYKFLQSFLIFCVDELVTTTDNQLSYLCFFGATYAVAMASWIILSAFFDRKTQAEVKQMRKDKIAKLLAEKNLNRPQIISMKDTDADMKTTLRTGKFGGTTFNETTESG